MSKLIFITALFALAACNLAGCNTLGGLGQDLQQAGAVISGTAIGAQNATTPGRQPPAPEPATPAPLLNCQPDANSRVPVGCPQPGQH